MDVWSMGFAGNGMASLLERRTPWTYAAHVYCFQGPFQKDGPFSLIGAPTGMLLVLNSFNGRRLLLTGLNTLMVLPTVS